MKAQKTPQNPFILTGYLSPEYFCDRNAETAKLTSALSNGRNVTLTSPRRMGKTGLIHHVFQQLRTENGIRCFYVDLYQTDSLRLLVKKLADTVLGIAKEGTVREIQSKKFISAHGLGAASTVKTAVSSLVEKELLLDDRMEYQLYDRFFGLWLSQSF